MTVPNYVALIAESLPSTEGYEKGFKDALESMCLALINKLSPEDLNEAITTALDAYSNTDEETQP